MSSHRYRHQCHGVVAEDVDDFDCDGVAAGFGVGVLGGGEFEVAVLPGPETLPFVFEDVRAGAGGLSALGLGMGGSSQLTVK